MAANEDSFKFEYGADFPAALDGLSQAILNRPLGHNFSPAELITQLNIAAEYKERTARRAGKGKRLEPSKFEGEMEVTQRKDAQAAALRLIVPKTKDEIPDVFLRRLDAHRTATEALIPPQTAPETNLDFIKRMVAVKANTEPNVIILPKSDQEGDAEFQSRLEVAKACPNMVFARGKSESADQFKLRMAQQAKSKQTIMPKAVDESDKGFKKRVETQFVCSFTIHPFDSKREKEEEYIEVRLKAHRELAMMSIEPGDMSILKKFAAEIKKEAAYEVDVGAIEKKLGDEKAAKEAAEAEAEAAKQAEKEREEAEKGAAAREAKMAEEDEKAKTKEEQDAKVAELMERRKAEAAKAREEELANMNRQKSFEEAEIDFASIGFMPLKKLLMERGVPKEAVFSCANKVALKEVALKHNVKLTFTEIS